MTKRHRQAPQTHPTHTLSISFQKSIRNRVCNSKGRIKGEIQLLGGKLYHREILLKQMLATQ